MMLYGSWLKLSLATRQTIAQAFGIAKTMPTHVQDNRIVSDGYKINDVENALNTEAMQAYLKTNEKDSSKLWQLLVDKTEGRTTEDVVTLPTEPEVPEAPEPQKQPIKSKTRAYAKRK